MEQFTHEILLELKEKLLEEQVRLFRELQSVGQRNPENPADWEATSDELEIMAADKNELADAAEELVDNTAILNELEVRLNYVKRALEKIELGTYGRCEVGAEPIPLERLKANPAASTCIEHADGLRPV